MTVLPSPIALSSARRFDLTGRSHTNGQFVAGDVAAPDGGGTLQAAPCLCAGSNTHDEVKTNVDACPSNHLIELAGALRVPDGPGFAVANGRRVFDKAEALVAWGVPKDQAGQLGADRGEGGVIRTVTLHHNGLIVNGREFTGRKLRLGVEGEGKIGPSGDASSSKLMMRGCSR